MNPYEELPLLPLVLGAVPEALVRALEQEGILWESLEASPLAGRFVLFDSSLQNKPILSQTQVAIDVQEFAPLAADDPATTPDDKRAARREWDIGGFRIGEEVARTDLRETRRRLLERLRQIIEAGGGVWLRLGAFPFPFRSAFNFRIDYDDFDPQDFSVTLNALEGHEQAFSHYVCGSAYESQPDALARLKNFHVGSHGYWHHTYRDRADNRRNIARGIDVLRGHGIEPVGFVAPHGRFNRGLLAAVEDLSISHSSQFGLAWDELPFYLPGSSVLELPIHPICLGLFLDAAGSDRSEPAQQHNRLAAADAAARHLTHVAREKYLAGEPVFLYGHPTGRVGRYPHVLARLLEAVDGMCGIWKTTLAQFADWWRARGQARLKLWREGEGFRIELNRALTTYPLAVEFCRGEHVATLPLDHSCIRFSPSALGYRRARTAALPQPVRIDPPQPWRARFLRYLDWEYATPVAEISTRSWSGWAKQTLRRFKGPDAATQRLKKGRAALSGELAP